MGRTGVRQAELSGLSRAETVAVLRDRVAALTGTSGAPAGPGSRGKLADAAVAPAARTLGLGAGLDRALPLSRGEVAEMGECPALGVEVIARATRAGLSAGVVGWPELSFAGVAESGGDLDRVVAVPDAGAHPLHVAGVLVEGVDLVVCRAAGELTPTAARPLLARLRSGAGALLAVGVRLPSPAVRAAARVVGFHGLGRGIGRITAVDLEVRTAVRGAAPHKSLLRVGPGAAAEVLTSPVAERVFEAG